MVAHDEVVGVLDPLGTEVLAAPEPGRHVLVRQQDVVHVDLPALDPHLVARLGDDPLDEGLVGVARVVEHDDVAGLGPAEELVQRLVDDQPVLVLQRRLHAAALDPGHLEPEGDDEGRVDRGGRKGLDPRHDLLAGARREGRALRPALGLPGLTRRQQVGRRAFRARSR